jgi:hypothetical protein
MDMKRLIIIAMGVCFLAYAPVARASWFYLTEGGDADADGDNPLTTSRTYSTQATCNAKAAAATSVVQGCVTNCDPANPANAWFLEQVGDNDSDGPRGYRGMGPYGFQADCNAGIADAVGAGMTSVMAACTLVTARKFSGCK